MLKKAILALVLVGSSSAAFAQPAFRDHRFDSRFAYNDHGAYDRSRGGTYYRGSDSYRAEWQRPSTSWMALSSPTRVSDDREGRVFINIDRRTPMMSTLRLEQVQGATYIFQVAVELADGRGTVKVRPEVVLDRGRPTLTVNLGGYQKVHRVIVYGENYSGHSSFALQGS